MKPALSMLIGCCFVAATAEAQSPSAPTALPRVTAPVMLVLDTVLFRLPRAQLSPTALVTMERSPALRFYSRGPLTGQRRSYAPRCVRMSGPIVGIVDPLLKLRTDSSRVGEIRPSIGGCGPVPASR